MFVHTDARICACAYACSGATPTWAALSFAMGGSDVSVESKTRFDGAPSRAGAGGSCRCQSNIRAQLDLSMTSKTRACAAFALAGTLDHGNLRLPWDSAYGTQYARPCGKRRHARCAAGRRAGLHVTSSVCVCERTRAYTHMGMHRRTMCACARPGHRQGCPGHGAGAGLHV